MIKLNKEPYYKYSTINSPIKAYQWIEINVDFMCRLWEYFGLENEGNSSKHWGLYDFVAFYEENDDFYDYITQSE
jgi:hypothetical protein